MKLFETIDIRLFESKNENQIKLIFKKTRNGIKGTDTPDNAFLLHNLSVPQAWTIQLSWSKETLPQGKTTLGRHLAESLRPLGMVHHLIWQDLSKQFLD